MPRKRAKAQRSTNSGKEAKPVTDARLRRLNENFAGRVGSLLFSEGIGGQIVDVKHWKEKAPRVTFFVPPDQFERVFVAVKR